VTWEILTGDAIERLRELPAESVQCCITSPPYHGLRDYGTGAWEGGDAACEHRASELRRGVNLAQSVTSTRGGAKKIAEAGWIPFRDVCGHCGAQRIDRQIGLEPTLDEYLDRLVEVFGEVWRVLRDDGTLWLNLGDGYASHTSGNPQTGVSERSALRGNGHAGGNPKLKALERPVRSVVSGLKAKDLVGLPWMVAFALRAAGWYLRSDVIWAKPNPLPESVTDRPTSAHEHLFLLAKSARYHYDADAIREPQQSLGERHEGRSGYRDGHPSKHGGYVNLQRALHPGGRNKRNVWEVATQPFVEAHFATFPPRLIEPCVLAGTSPRACGACGAPWQRIMERTFYGNLRTADNKDGHRDLELGLTRNEYGGQKRWEEYEPPRTVGWRPSCGHEDGSGRCVVLDPFAGSGTVGVVCGWHGRDFVGVELNPEYAEMARRRILTEGSPSRRPSEHTDPLPGQLELSLEP